MNVLCMRQVLKDQYPSEKWRTKVSKMSDSQVIAVYHRIANRPLPKSDKTEDVKSHHQMTLFECGLQQGGTSYVQTNNSSRL